MLKLSFQSAAMAAALIACAAPAKKNASPPEAADTIIHGGPIVTMNGRDDVAQALAIRAGTIIAVGDSSDVFAHRSSSTEMIDLHGATAYPGFIDSHIHFSRLGKRARELYLDDTKTPAEAVAIAAAQAANTKPGTWIIGKGWHTVNWGEQYPDHRELSRASPNHPVYLAGMANHAAWVNQRAMELAGITAQTPDPADGRILRDADGEPTGVLIESAKSLVAQHLPKDDATQRRIDFEQSVATALELGITQAHDAGSSDDDIALYEKLLEDGKLGLRLHLFRYIEKDGEELDRFLSSPPKHRVGGRLNVEGIKIYADGALGARGAALLAPYSDDAQTRGLVANDAAAIESIVAKASAAGYQVATHAIGDRGNRAVLDAVKNVRRVLGERVRRPRIEHAQVISPQDIPRFAELGVIAAMQPIHCTMDMGFAVKRLGPVRAEGAYAWRSLLDSGAVIAGGADTPAFPIKYSNPLWGIHAAITRQDNSGQPAEGFYPQQRVTALEAVAMYTRAGAFAGFNEDITGSLEVGKLADLTVLSGNLLEMPPSDILRTTVVMTIVDGTIAYDAR